MAIKVNFLGALTLDDIAERIERASTEQLESKLKQWFTGLVRTLQPTLAGGGGPVPASIAISPRPATSGLLDRLALPAKVHAKRGLRCAIAFLISDRHLRLARAYGERFPDEMEAFIEDNRRPLDELRRLYPFLQAGT